MARQPRPQPSSPADQDQGVLDPESPGAAQGSGHYLPVAELRKLAERTRTDWPDGIEKD